MKETNKKGERFYGQWEKQREKKWSYIFLHGSIYWGVPVAIGTFILSSHFEIEYMSISKLILSLVIFMIGGLGFGLSQFRRIDNIYLGLNDEDEISNGIQTLESGDIWNYENLKITKTGDESLNVQNQMIWFDEKELTAEKLDECFNLVVGDFERLKKNPEFARFVKNRKVRFRIADNSEKGNLLLEKLMEEIV